MTSLLSFSLSTTWRLALSLVAGVDVWLNTPLRPLEASRTSGLKAALNGVPSLSVPDGWWREGCIEGVTGCAIGSAAPVDTDQADHRDGAELYRKLEHVIAPLFAITETRGWMLCDTALS